MSFTPQETTLDGFLDGRLQIRQPKLGYRAATDPVFLAAAVDAKPGQSVLELGCGVGVASLCLGWRVPELQMTGLELQPDYTELARQNAAHNDIELAVFDGDLCNLPNALREMSFDHVFFNPPYFNAGSLPGPASSGKKTAHVEQAPLSDWISCGLKRLKPGGRLTIIHLAKRLPDLSAGLLGKTGDISILPLAPRIGQAAKRVIVSARKGSKGAGNLLPSFHIHQGDKHVDDADSYTDQARAVLRDGIRLNCIEES